MEEIYDVLILGGGPGGLTAAIYAGRYNLKTLVVARSFGGALGIAGEIENWPGFLGKGGDLMKSIQEQAKKFGAKLLEGNLDKVEKSKKGFTITVDGNKIEGRSLIVALGTEHRQLDVPGEKKFIGKGVSYCATCDGNFFKGKDVAVVGGADSAAKAAIYLGEICNKVYLVYRRGKMRCEPVLFDKIKKMKNVEIIYNSNPTEIIGDKVVSGLKIDTEGKHLELKVSGVFVEIGATPAKEVIGGLGLKMEKDYIITDKSTRTNIEGVFAAGDMTNIVMRQAITAAGEGATAAKMVKDYLTEKE